MNKSLLSKSYLTILVLILFSFAIVSCDNFDSDQTTPSFIYVKGFNLVENTDIIQSSDDGFQTEDIQDAWIYVDNKYIGTYVLPCTVPILKEGKHKIDVRPGVKLNGIALTRTEYPFYTYYSNNHNLVSGKTDTIPPIDIKYISDYIVFGLTELFERPYLAFTTDGLSSDTNKLVVCKNQDTVKWGSSCGAMYLNSSESLYRIISDSIFCNNYSSLILEIDYWCNIPFEIGICGRPSPAATIQYVSAMALYPNETKGWQKVYVVLGKVWSQISYPNDFRVYFTPQKKSGVANGWVYIDNVKIIHKPNK
ncbi:MAG: hypothetical protein WC135_00360 [Bacteroidales bacterium]